MRSLLEQYWWLCLLVSTFRGRVYCLEGVLNYRACQGQQRLYRSASLDTLTIPGAKKLLQSEVSAIIDLRSADEIEKGAKDRTAGAKFLYDRLPRPQNVLDCKSSSSPSRLPVLYHAPLLSDIDGFWATVESRMQPAELGWLRLRSIFDGGAVPRATARALEDGGLALLYEAMLSSRVHQAYVTATLEVCLRCAEEGHGVIFHCQKGKDRIGCLSMLIESGVMDLPDEDILAGYSASAALLGEDIQAAPRNRASRTCSSDVDWSRLRGSPPEAMLSTIKWIRKDYGSVADFLKSSGFTEEKLRRLRYALIG